jgi:Domain of unknown function (DUF222)
LARRLAAARERAEADLARLGSQFGPEPLAGMADRLNPDGIFTDADRARRRGLTMGKQGADGTSELRARITPEAQSTEETIEKDTRSLAQRQHDALNAGYWK